MKELLIAILGMTAAAGLFYAHSIEQEAHAESLRKLRAATEQAADLQRRLDKAHDFIEETFNLDDVGDLTTWSTTVTVSAYSARVAECDLTPEVTADMTPSRIGLLAVSRDLLQWMGLKYGDVVMLEGIGVFNIHDTMHPRWTSRVDILHASPEAARLFGIRKGVKLIRVIDYADREG